MLAVLLLGLPADMGVAWRRRRRRKRRRKIWRRRRRNRKCM
jgi:hypothetical protein